MSRQGVFGSRQSLFKARSFYVTTEFSLGQGFYVATNWFYAMTKFGQDQEFLCHDKIFLCLDRFGQGEVKLYRDKIFLCHDRVWSKLRTSMSR